MKTLFTWTTSALTAMTVRLLISHYCHVSSRRQRCLTRHVPVSDLP